MNIVIQVRGTNGSGKTQVVYDLMKKFGHVPIRNGGGQIWGVRICLNTDGHRLFAPGPYRKPPTGGCDNIPTIDDSVSRVQELAKCGDVIFEGAMISTITGRWLDCMNSVPNVKPIFAYLDTPLEKCIERIIHRRKIAHIDDKILIPEKSVIPKYKAVQSTRRRFEALGLDCRTLPHENTMETILGWLKGDRQRRFPRK